ncbi:MAG: hypothetical protein KQJ78_24705 [Deltaproteobacteria bacterium]|nr:hypothetical protein [Deltaproteobacteria bacterium]
MRHPKIHRYGWPLVALALVLVWLGCGGSEGSGGRGSDIIGERITLTAYPDTIPENSTARIVAEVLNAEGQKPDDGTIVNFFVQLGRLSASQVGTVDGMATVFYQAPNNYTGEDRITAHALTQTATITVNVVPGLPTPTPTPTPNPFL